MPAIMFRCPNTDFHVHQPARQMPALGLGCAKTKSDLVVMPSGRQIFAFFCSPHDDRAQNSGCDYTAKSFHTARVRFGRAARGIEGGNRQAANLAHAQGEGASRARKERRCRCAGMSAVLTHPEITPQRPDCLPGVRGLELGNVALRDAGPNSLVSRKNFVPETFSWERERG